MFDRILRGFCLIALVILSGCSSLQDFDPDWIDQILYTPTPRPVETGTPTSTATEPPQSVTGQPEPAVAEPRILRLRIGVELENRGTARLFVAKGHIEIQGPDLQASVETEDAYKSVDLLIDKLDRMLRKRTTALHGARGEDDIRNHAD